MSEVPEKPRLRWLEVRPSQLPDGEAAYDLVDPHELEVHGITVPLVVAAVCELLDGTRTLRAVADEFRARHKVSIGHDDLEKLVRGLDERLLLDSERSRAAIDAWRKGAVREPACMGWPDGCYPAEPAALRTFLDEHPDREGGPGQRSLAGPPIHGVISPHIDFRRGGHGYAWAWKAVGQSCEAETFVVFGTAHKGTGRARFALTRKSYRTPLGTLETDLELVERLLASYEGEDDLFDGEIAHKREHSIEFQMVELAHLYGEGSRTSRKIKVLPVLCGGLDDLYGERPSRDPSVRAFHEALAKALADVKKDRLCVVAGVDFAHVGASFDDLPIEPRALEAVMAQDRRSLEVLTSKVDGDAFHADIASDRNARRVCGHSAIVAAVECLARREAPLAGQLLHHDRWYDGKSSVSFASLVYRAK